MDETSNNVVRGNFLRHHLQNGTLKDFDQLIRMLEVEWLEFILTTEEDSDYSRMVCGRIREELAARAQRNLTPPAGSRPVGV